MSQIPGKSPVQKACGGLRRPPQGLHNQSKEPRTELQLWVEATRIPRGCNQGGAVPRIHRDLSVTHWNENMETNSMCVFFEFGQVCDYLEEQIKGKQHWMTSWVGLRKQCCSALSTGYSCSLATLWGGHAQRDWLEQVSIGVSKPRESSAKSQAFDVQPSLASTF